MDSFGLRALPLLCLLWVTPIAALPPPFVTSTETAPVVSTSPAEEPEAWLLAFLDVETSGLELFVAFNSQFDVAFSFATEQLSED
jgi:hypothetical protein